MVWGGAGLDSGRGTEGVERDGGWGGFRILCACGFYLHLIASMHRSLLHTCPPPSLGLVGSSMHREGGRGGEYSFQRDNRTILTELEVTDLRRTILTELEVTDLTGRKVKGRY